jgi:hypothetical protein
VIAGAKYSAVVDGNTEDVTRGNSEVFTDTSEDRKGTFEVAKVTFVVCKGTVEVSNGTMEVFKGTVETSKGTLEVEKDISSVNRGALVVVKGRYVFSDGVGEDSDRSISVLVVTDPMLEVASFVRFTVRYLKPELRTIIDARTMGVLEIVVPNVAPLVLVV